MMPKRTQSSTRRAAAPGQGQILLLRYSGDLTTKADATRRNMTRRLVDNLRASIKASGRTARVRPSRDRIFVELDPQAPGGAADARATDPEATDAPASDPGPSDAEMVLRLARVFGVQSVSLTHAAPWQTLADVVREGVAFGEPHVRGRRFAIRARRMGERHEVELSGNWLTRSPPRGGEISLGNRSRVRSALNQEISRLSEDERQALFEYLWGTLPDLIEPQTGVPVHRVRQINA